MSQAISEGDTDSPASPIVSSSPAVFRAKAFASAGAAPRRARIKIKIKNLDFFYGEVKDRLSAQASSISLGQQQRLCIARALATSPEVILFDEPTCALDPLSTEKIETLIGELKRDFTILIVTHNMEPARRRSSGVSLSWRNDRGGFDSADVRGAPDAPHPKLHLRAPAGLTASAAEARLRDLWTQRRRHRQAFAAVAAISFPLSQFAGRHPILLAASE